jgi:hypothetical protein
MIAVKKQSQIRLTPLRDPVRLNVVMERDALRRLKSAAVDMDTTASEIVRSLVDGFLNDLSTDATRARDAKDIPRDSRFVKL